MWNIVTNRIRDIDRTGTRIDYGFDYPTQEIQFRATGVFRGKLNVVGLAARELD